LLVFILYRSCRNLDWIDPHGSLLCVSQKKESVHYKPVSAIAPAAIPLLKKYSTQVENLLDKGEATDQKTKGTE